MHLLPNFILATFPPAQPFNNRTKAIIYAMKNSDPYEIILVAGKGHETYQDLGSKSIFFSDKNIIKSFLLYEYE